MPDWQLFQIPEILPKIPSSTTGLLWSHFYRNTRICNVRHYWKLVITSELYQNLGRPDQEYPPPLPAPPPQRPLLIDWNTTTFPVWRRRSVESLTNDATIQLWPAILQIYFTLRKWRLYPGLVVGWLKRMSIKVLRIDRMGGVVSPPPNTGF